MPFSRSIALSHRIRRLFAVVGVLLLFVRFSLFVSFAFGVCARARSLARSPFVAVHTHRFTFIILPDRRKNGTRQSSESNNKKNHFGLIQYREHTQRTLSLISRVSVGRVR